MSRRTANAVLLMTALAVSTPAQTSSAPARRAVIQVDKASLEGSGPWTSWFGAHPQRTLVVTVRNTGNIALIGGVLEVSVGRGARPSKVVARQRVSLPVGKRTTLRQRVDLPMWSLGRYHVRGDVVGLSGEKSFTMETSAYPWGLLAVAIVAVQVLLLVGRNRTRRWLRQPERPPPEPFTLPPPPAAASDRAPAPASERVPAPIARSRPPHHMRTFPTRPTTRRPTTRRPTTRRPTTRRPTRR